jgi:hypothetical protein
LIGEGVASDVDLELTAAVVAALYSLARTWAERRVVDKLMVLVNA